MTIFNKKKNTNIPLEKRMPLNIGDILNIPSGGSVSILDKESSQIIHCNESGEISVKTLIDHARANNNKIVKHINSEIATSKNKKSTKSSSSIAALGVGTRGSISPKGYLKIASAIKGAVTNPASLKACPLLKLLNDNEGLLSFQITNPTDRELQVNIAKIDTVKNHITLCFLFDEKTAMESLLILPGEMIDYSQFSFAPLTDDEVLVPFATEGSYNPIVLNRILKNPEESKTDNNKSVDNSVYFGRIINQ